MLAAASACTHSPTPHLSRGPDFIWLEALQACWVAHTAIRVLPSTCCPVSLATCVLTSRPKEGPRVPLWLQQL